MLTPMGVRSRNLLALLVAAVALSPVRALATHHVGHPHPDGHGHAHEHFHGGDPHSHGHHHHDDAGADEGSDHHHGILDNLLDGPKLTWSGPRRKETDAPPTLPAPAVARLTSDADWHPSRRAKPPPRSGPAHQHLISIRTIILRL